MPAAAVEITAAFSDIVPVEETGFTGTPAIKDIGTVSLDTESLKMIYANDSTSIPFPTGTDDSTSETLTTKFWMAETEVTNAVMAEVLQWAYYNGRFSGAVGDPNGLDTTTAKHGGQQLINLGSTDCQVHYNGSGTFSVESGFENHPVTNITWYGAVMFCNWLTEMRDGTTDNVEYTGIDTNWVDDETTENISRNGYRLPSRDEWEYAARYRGTDTTNAVYSNPYYYTKGNSASGAVADYNEAAACQAVAVYNGQSPTPSDEAEVKSLGTSSANALGLYDMSGNVLEWCFTESDSYRIYRGGYWEYNALNLQFGYVLHDLPDYEGDNLGFRFCRTAD
jgi:formylglycine-generating enzyme required for sulfatase activity